MSATFSSVRRDNRSLINSTQRVIGGEREKSLDMHNTDCKRE